MIQFDNENNTHYSYTYTLIKRIRNKGEAYVSEGSGNLGR